MFVPLLMLKNWSTCFLSFFLICAHGICIQTIQYLIEISHLDTIICMVLSCCVDYFTMGVHSGKDLHKTNKEKNMKNR